MREGPAKWVGKVRVTVVSNLSRSKLLDIDECMDVRASYEPTMDSALAADMQRLAIFEKASDCATIPAPLTPVDIDPVAEHVPDCPCDILDKSAPDLTSRDFAARNVSMTEELPPTSVLDSETPSSSDDYFIDGDFAVPADAVVFDDPFMPVSTPRYDLPEFLERAMLPADPSTLPGGIELCMDGMDLEDDWCSFMSREKDAVSSASTVTASSTTSNYAADQLVPQPVIVPDQPLPKSQPEPQPLQASPTPAPILASATIQPQFQPPTLRQFPLAQQAAPPPLVPIAMPPVVPKEEAELFMETMEQKPLPMNHGVSLAPRPAGMAACADGFIWQMGNAPGNMYLVQSRLEVMEKERKAEERRKKNRQAAARSNARKKSTMDGFKSEIKASKARIADLRRHELELRQQNYELKRGMDMSD